MNRRRGGGGGHAPAAEGGGGGGGKRRPQLEYLLVIDTSDLRFRRVTGTEGGIRIDFRAFAFQFGNLTEARHARGGGGR